MHIVVDSLIPDAATVLSGFGDVIAIPGHEIRPENVENATALIVRSVTRVDKAMLSGSSVRFVGSATSGMDHVDTAWLSSQGISCVNAHGANANSVVEYVLASIAEGCDENGLISLQGRTAGVVGHGAVGSVLSARLRALGCRVLVCDPFRPEHDTDLDDLLRDSEIVSLHVPLTDEGPFPTRNLLPASRIARMKAGAMLIQTSRGGVLEDAAAVRARSEGRLSWLVLDVWQDEPVPVPELVAGVDLATPHIAGYSRDAKSEGLRRVVQAFREWLGASDGGAPDAWAKNIGAVGAVGAVGADAGPTEGPTERIIQPDPSARSELAAWIRPMYDIRADDARFRATLGLPPIARRAAFHALRGNYPPRWGFHHYQAAIKGQTAAPGQDAAPGGTILDLISGREAE